jgi:hypothetical protein
MLGNSWAAAELAVSREGPSSMSNNNNEITVSKLHTSVLSQFIRVDLIQSIGIAQL